MARVAPLNEDQETQFGKAEDAAGGAVPSTVPEASAAGGGAAQAPQAQRPGKFQDISRLLNANKGQGERLAQRAVGAVTDKANAAQNQLQSAQGAYRTQAQASVPQAQQQVRPQVVQGGSLFNPRQTTTQNVAGPDYAAMQRQAEAVYGGPARLAETQGVDTAALSRSFTDAERAANTLTAPAGVSALLGRTGGGGLLTDLLASREGGSTLRAAKERFGGLREMLSSALGDTSAADHARTATEAAAAEARGGLAQRDADAQAFMDRQTAERAAAESQRQQDESLYEQFMTQWPMAEFAGRSFDGTEMPSRLWSAEKKRAWFEANKERIRKALRGGL